MRLSIIALDNTTDFIIKEITNKYPATVYVLKDSGKKIKEVYREARKSSDIVIFVSNTAIAVRTIAPYLKSKWEDPGVLVIDCTGRYVISLIGGHWGLSNKMAKEIAFLIEAIPVITTKSELLGITPFDFVSRENNLKIENPDVIKYIASRFSREKTVNLYTDLPVKDLPENIKIYSLDRLFSSDWGVVISEKKLSCVSRKSFLFLRPMNILIGMGYRREEDPRRIIKAIEKALSLFDISPTSIKTISTIDIKEGDGRGEVVGRFFGVPIRYVHPEKLFFLDKIYSGSLWVRKSVGIGSVSLTTMIYGYKGVNILLRSENINGIVISIGRIRKVINFGR